MPSRRASWLSALVVAWVSVGWQGTARAQSQAGFPPAPPGVGPQPQPGPPAPPPGYPGSVPQGYQAPPPYAQELGPFQRHDVDEAPLDRPGYVQGSRKAGRRLHDGFYLRVGGGIGVGNFSASTEPFQFYVQDQGIDRVDQFDGSASGFAYGTQIAVGGALRPGAILALAFHTLSLPQATMSRPVAEFSSYEYKISQAAGVGPSFAFYPDPEGGLHFSGGPSVVGIIVGQGDPTLGARARGHTVLGWGFNLGAGYDWWVGEEWSLGLQARLDYTHGSGSDARNNDWTHTLWAPTVGLGLTYN